MEPILKCVYSSWIKQDIEQERVRLQPMFYVFVQGIWSPYLCYLDGKVQLLTQGCYVMH